MTRSGSPAVNKCVAVMIKLTTRIQADLIIDLEK